MNNSTCPDGKLEPTFWDRPDQYEYFKDLNILLSSTAPRPTSTPSPAASVGGGSKPSGAVIGGAVGGTLGFVAIVVVVVFLLWRKKRQNHKQASSDPASSIEENKREAGKLASPKSAGTGTCCSPPTLKQAISDIRTAPPTYSWDVNGNPPVQQSLVHNQLELPGEDPRDSLRKPYAELHSRSSLTRIAELPGGSAANELDTPEATPRAPHTEFGNDMAKQVHELGDKTQEEPR